MKSIENRVKDGAKFLDLHVVGWVDKVDVENLDIKSNCTCIWGQLGRIAMPEEISDATNFGMLFSLIGDTRTEYAALTAAWKKLILARRSESQQPAPELSRALTAKGAAE